MARHVQTRAPAVYNPWPRAAHLVFEGTLSRSGKTQVDGFTCLADDNAPPVITDGGPQITPITRARRVAYTTTSGYNPVAMDVAVRFDATVNTMGAAAAASTNTYTPDDLEADLDVLEWMGGRGRLYKQSGVGTPGVGDPPIVTVASYLDSAHRKQSNLIRPSWQYPFQWVVNGSPDWGTQQLNSIGNRTLVCGVIHLVQWVGAPGTRTTTTSKATDTAQTFASYLTGQSGNGDTIKSVTDKHVQSALQGHDIYRAVAKATAQQNPGGPVSGNTRATQHLPPGTKLYIPQDYTATLVQTSSGAVTSGG